MPFCVATAPSHRSSAFHQRHEPPATSRACRVTLTVRSGAAGARTHVLTPGGAVHKRWLARRLGDGRIRQWIVEHRGRGLTVQQMSPWVSERLARRWQKDSTYAALGEPVKLHPEILTPAQKVVLQFRLREPHWSVADACYTAAVGSDGPTTEVTTRAATRAPGSLACMIVCLASACAVSAPAPPEHAPFQGLTTDVWLAYGVALPARDPDELLAAFDAGAQRYGCRTEALGAMDHAYPRSPYILLATEDVRSRRGVAAFCGEDTIALLAAGGGEVRVGCARPTTRERCDLVLTRISEAR